MNGALAEVDAWQAEIEWHLNYYIVFVFGGDFHLDGELVFDEPNGFHLLVRDYDKQHLFFN